MSETNKKETWINNKWRPMMGWTYIAVVIFDFIVGPVFWTVWQAQAMGAVAQQWMPLTLGAGGLFHLSMGAILGVTSWSRGREKMQGVAGGGFMGEMIVTKEKETLQQTMEKSIEDELGI